MPRTRAKKEDQRQEINSSTKQKRRARRRITSNRQSTVQQQSGGTLSLRPSSFNPGILSPLPLPSGWSPLFGSTNMNMMLSNPNFGNSIKWIKCTGESFSKCQSPVQVDPDSESTYVAAAYHNCDLVPGIVNTSEAPICEISWGTKVHRKTEFLVLSNPTDDDLVWQPAVKGDIPVGALQGGYTVCGERLYIGRISHAGHCYGPQYMTYIGGKVHPSHHVCYVPFEEKEISSATYEVLCLKTVPLSFLGIE